MSSQCATSWVQERRLRPIYELLDAGCNKKVIQEVDRLLKKSPNFACAKVLKGLALIRQNKRDEAKVLLDAVAAEVPTDDGTIQALSICYREIDRPDELGIVLEAACEKDKSEELLTHCFMAQVRLSEYQKMHKTALQLYKLYNKTTYYAWAVASLLFKHEASGTMVVSNENIPLELAERMMDKLTKDLKSPLDDNLINLYIRILNNKAKWQKIYDVLKSSGYPSPNWINDDFHSYYTCALRKLNKPNELISYFQAAYAKNNDEYDLLKQIIDVFGKSDYQKVEDFLNGLLDANPNRAVALADLHFSFEYCEDSVALGRFERDLQMAITYGADKPSFFSDVGKYFKLVDVETQLRLVNSLVPVKKKGSNESNFNSIAKIIKDVNFEMIFKELISRDKEGASRLRQANICFGKYLLCEEVQASLRTEDHLRTKESDFHDQYIIIAATNLLEESYKSKIILDQPSLAEYLTSTKWTNIDDKELIALRKRVESNGLQMWNEMKQRDSLTESFEQLSLEKEHSKAHLNSKEALITFAISILEYGLARSPYNYSMRILLSKAYGKLGAVVAALKIMQGLDLKHVQWDSLGYLFLPQAFTSGTYTEALRMCSAAQNMYSTYKRESMEHVIAAYKYGSFNKVGEFLAFRMQLMESIACASLCANKELLELMLASTKEELLRAADPSSGISDDLLRDHSVSDNRDFSVLQHFDENVDLQAIKEATADTEYYMKMLRLTLILMLHKIVRFLRGIECQDLLTLDNMIEKYDSRLTRWLTVYQPQKHENVMNAPQFHGIYPPLYAQNFRIGTPVFIIQQIKCVSEMLKYRESPSLKILQTKILESANVMLKVVRNNYEIFLKEKGLSFIEPCIHDFHIILEAFSFSRILLDVAVTMTKSYYEARKSKGPQKERNNSVHLFKKSASYTIKAVLEKYQELHVCFVDFINELKRRPIPSMKHVGDCIQPMIDSSFLVVAFQNEFITAQNNIRHSHMIQLEEMRRISAMLIEYIRNIDP